MLDIKVRLISMLGLITIVVIISLVLDYFRVLRRPVRLGLSIAMLGIVAGFVLTLNAVLPANHFYGPVFSEIKTNQKLVALTFDDGPYPPYTGQILDILKERQIPATFLSSARMPRNTLNLCGGLSARAISWEIIRIAMSTF